MYKSIGIVLSGLLAIASAGVRAGDIGVADAWIREAPPHAAALAGYLSLSNASAVPVTLDSISSADFGSIEIHRSEMHEGMMHMRKESGLRIEAGSSLALEPGGVHLMLLDGRRALRAGDVVVLRLRFSDGEDIAIDAPVRR
jgi:copper(I)-binding protein